MKKLFIWIAGLLVFTGSSAQVFDGGLTGGLTATQVDGDYYSGFNKVGVMFGAYTEVRFSKELAGKLALCYKQKGATERTFQETIIGGETFQDLTAYYKLALHYVELPVTVQYFWRDNITFDAGLSAGYLMGARFADETSPNLRIDEPFKAMDYNMFIGLGYRFSDKFNLSLKYAYSLVPIRERNTGRYRGFFPDVLNITDGDYNNLLTLALDYQLNTYD